MIKKLGKYALVISLISIIILLLINAIIYGSKSDKDDKTYPGNKEDLKSKTAISQDSGKNFFIGGFIGKLRNVFDYFWNFNIDSGIVLRDKDKSNEKTNNKSNIILINTSNMYLPNKGIENNIKLINEDANEKVVGSSLNVSVKGLMLPYNSCTIRAKGGSLVFGQEYLGDNNKLYFYIPLKNANKGEGYLTGQKGRKRFSYKFTIEQVSYNDDDKMTLDVDGIYTVDGKDENNEAAIITIDKKNLGVSVNGLLFRLDNLELVSGQDC
ncbi:MAG: hypothetical protein Q8N99_05015 [Nanoarchaeota archaeon]|nr:hypothetical protein [Nanoarchaeota archaeon]